MLQTNWQADMVRDLREPGSYPNTPELVQVVETHISWVFLTGDYVYKVKKAVNLGFLDFSTLEKRRFACNAEVRFNRRLAPDVYLGVSEVREEAGRYRVDGPGRTVDYAVVMRQLPAEGEMRAMLRRGALTADHVRTLARRIAAFHREARSDADTVRLGGHRALRQTVEENFQQIEGQGGVAVERHALEDLRAYSLAYLDARRGAFRGRERAGSVREGHGDLHLGQVIFEGNRPQVLDCIEFSDRLRCGDVASDVAFMAMDLEAEGRPDLSDTFVREYVAATGDDGLLRFLPFFKTHRACVRGKVLTLQALQMPEGLADRASVLDRARRYHALARGYASAQRPSPALYLVGGSTGTGKTTLVDRLVETWDVDRLSSDPVRKELAGVSPNRRPVPVGEGIYSPEMTARTYAELARRAEESLRHGRTVVVDATFHRMAARGPMIGVAARAGVPLYLARCTLPDSLARRRLEERAGQAASLRPPTGHSDGTWEVHQAQQAAYEPPTDLPRRHVAEVSTAASRETAFRALLEALWRMVLAER